MYAKEARKITNEVQDARDIELKHVYSVIRKAAEQGLGTVSFRTNIGNATKQRLIDEGYGIGYSFCRNEGQLTIISW